MFEAIANFRDFGDKRLRGGGRLCKSTLLRSGSLGEATPADIALLDRHNVSLVLDLRRVNERQSQPNRLPKTFAGKSIENQDPASGEAPHIAFLRQFSGDPQELQEMVLNYYRAIPADEHLNKAVRETASLLTEMEGALLIHCSAGKDRTGLVVSVLLEALGAHEDDVMADYLASTGLISEDRIGPLTEHLERLAGRSLPLAILRKMFGVEREWLLAARQAIFEHHGSMSAYCASIGLGGETLERLRAKLAT